VKRPERVRVKYLDETGAEQEIETGGLLARCLQHEIDHLDGVLFIDHISLLKRNMALSKMKKLKAEHARNRPSKG
jgi:peptide deformylase